MQEEATDFRRPRRRARRLTGSAGSALAISFVAHAVAAVTIGAALHATSEPGQPRPEVVQVDLAPAPAPPPAPADSPSAAPVPAARSEGASAPHRRARAARAPAAVASAPRPDSQEAPVARFVMVAGTVATHAGTGSPGGSASAPGVTPAGSEAVVREGDVDAPARLLRPSPLVYPPAARQAEIEIDFPVEIVVDTDGRVISARPLRHAGYGLDEAAIRAIRDYRFSPAMRGGRPVRVSMRWTVQFRLR